MIRLEQVCATPEPHELPPLSSTPREFLTYSSASRVLTTHNPTLALAKKGTQIIDYSADIALVADH